MIVLGIESSCDETAASVVRDGKELLSNVVFSSMDLHAAFGGVVPEIAARSHVESIIPVIEKALEEAFSSENSKLEAQKNETNPKPEMPNKKKIVSSNRKMINDKSMVNGKWSMENVSDPSTFNIQHSTVDPWEMIDAIAVTYGAGLGGSLLVGVMTARTLAITKNKPLYAINHVEGHVYANFITEVSVNPKSEVRSPKQMTKSEISTSNINNQKSKINSLTNLWQLGNETYVLPSEQPQFPILALIVSGGHSQLVLFRNHFDYTLLGQTRDDAIGEAFDKVAKITGLPYPGGPSIAQAALSGDAYKYELPKSRLEGSSEALKDLRSQILDIRNNKEYLGSPSPRSKIQDPRSFHHNYDFSFSGIKTAVLRVAQEIIGEDYRFPSFKLAERLSEAQKNDLAASFQRVAIETVVDKTILAFNEFQPKSVVIAGGVAANQELRRQLEAALLKVEGLKLKVGTSQSPILHFTDPKLCTDNGAMIATLGCFKAMLNAEPVDAYSLQIEPNLSM